MNAASLLLTIIGQGTIYSLLAVLLERLFIVAGLTRGNTIGLVIATFVLTALKQLVDYDGSPFIFGLFIIVIGTLGVNRHDLVKTLQKGKWWWKSENNGKDS